MVTPATLAGQRPDAVDLKRDFENTPDDTPVGWINEAHPPLNR
jgi:hypothetical protein